MCICAVDTAFEDAVVASLVVFRFTLLLKLCFV